jgi:hypothetical protein
MILPGKDFFFSIGHCTRVSLRGQKKILTARAMQSARYPANQSSILMHAETVLHESPAIMLGLEKKYK